MQTFTQRSVHPFLLGFIAYLETCHFPHHRLTFNVTTLLSVTSSPTLVVVWLRFLRDTRGKGAGDSALPQKKMYLASQDAAQARFSSSTSTQADGGHLASSETSQEGWGLC